jgi:signal transduction histidine kinase
MNTTLPVREANRVFLVTIFARLVMYTLGYYVLALVRVPPPGVMLIPVAPTLITAALAAFNWYDRRLGEGFLKWILYLDIFNLSVQAMPFLLLQNLLSVQHAWIVSELTLVSPNILMLFSLVLIAWAYGRRGALWASTWAAALTVFSGMLSMGTELFGLNYVLRQALQILLLYTVPLLVSVLAVRERQYLSELEQAHDSLKRHAATVEQLAISQERNRLARDLHDTLTHSLAGLAIHLEALRTLLIHDPTAAAKAAEDAVVIARKGLAESRQAIAALRVDPVAAEGLVGAIRIELDALRSRTGLETQLVVAGEEIELTQEEGQTLFRILEEALTNAERHAHAARVTVRLAFGADRTELVLHDDGIGFDPAQVQDDHYGLRGMSERAHIIGAELRITSHRDSGTQIWCALPR